MKAVEVAEILDRALSLDALSEEYAPGLLGDDGDVTTVHLFGPGDSVMPRPDVFTVAFEEDVTAARGLAKHWKAPFYAPGLAPSSRAMHLRAVLSAAGYEHPHTFLPRDLGEWTKLVTYVPEPQLEAVAAALAAAGAGRFERYDGCSFRIRGMGAFRGLENSKPAVGKPGSPERIEEWRLEVTVPARRTAGVLEALRGSHPYEEPAFDLYPLISLPLVCGVGLTVQLEDGVQVDLCRAIMSAGAEENALLASLEGARRLTLVHAAFGEMLAPAVDGEARWIGGKGDHSDVRTVHVGRAFQRLLGEHIRASLAGPVASGQLREVAGHGF